MLAKKKIIFASTAILASTNSLTQKHALYGDFLYSRKDAKTQREP